MQWKDNFSTQANQYVQYRPHYPQDLFQWIAHQASNRERVWDCATGSGQAALGLVPYFQEIIATDASQKQIHHAIRAINIDYKVAHAENSLLPAQSIDVITSAQAAHWFAHENFFKEVHRVLKPSGVLAIWGYGLLYTNTPLDDIIQHFYREVIGNYWDKERKYLDERYETMPFPFELMPTPAFKMQHDWDLEQLIGYLNTWSSVQKFIIQEKYNPTEILKEELLRTWKNPNSLMTFTWDIFLKIGRND